MPSNSGRRYKNDNDNKNLDDRDRRRYYDDDDGDDDLDGRFNKHPRAAEHKEMPVLVAKIPTLLCLLSWVALFSVWVLISVAKPDSVTMFTHIQNMNSRFSAQSFRSNWDIGVLWIAFSLMLVSLASGIAALVINILRYRNKTAKLKTSIIVNCSIMVLAAVFFMISYAKILF